MPIQSPLQTESTRQAARECLAALQHLAPERATPRGVALATLRCLAQRPRASWRIDDREGEAPHGAASLWAHWFSAAGEAERPLLYLTRADSSARCAVLAEQAGGRGIFLNDIEAQPSRWPKGAQPWLPLWLRSHPQCLPYDPASAEEALAILRGALRALYLEGEGGFCYLSLHDRADASPPLAVPDSAWHGLYALEGTAPAEIDLLGAGASLHRVRAAAKRLAVDWGIQACVWSATSYTRLAREASRQRRLRRRGLPGAEEVAHLQACLGGRQAPVLAVTGYARAIAEQLGEHLAQPFQALGADSLDSGQALEAEWIAVCALDALIAAGRADPALAARARRRYRLD
ncbi:MAG: Pyruvate dehydrogenase E1 component [Pseudomonas citronellolis]|nr:MAG: Pyruvate dehydrogenase E1 component [Pseudomonas citronellolis]